MTSPPGPLSRRRGGEEFYKIFIEPGIFFVFPDKQIKTMVYLGKTNRHWAHFGAFPETFRLAKQLRRNMTATEKIVWQELRSRFLSEYKFRRQHPVREFIVDFICLERGLVIEIDGGIHQRSEVKERDENRTVELERMGLKVIRFTNDEVMNDLNAVKHKIKAELLSPPLLLERGPGGEAKRREGVGGEAKRREGARG
jgi:very-short-patch-repair endonuclease